MTDLDTVQSRLDAIERKLDDAMKRLASEGEVSKVRRRGRAGRIFWGILILVLGLIWLGQNLNIAWLSGLKFWPAALIVVGLFLIFGDRNG